jgi:hypothetical protein
MEPREFVNTELKLIEHMFNIQKEIYPTVVLIKDNEHHPMPVSYRNAVHKDIVSQGIKDLVKKFEPDVVVYMAEAWTKIIRDKSDRIPIAIAADDPDKYEILCVQIEFKTGEKFGAEAKIIRKEDRVLLEPFTVKESDWTMGRFVDFFPIKQVN